MAEKILAIQGNSFKNLNIITDTTYLLALEAQRRNYKIYWYETKDINFINSKLIAQICHIKFLEKIVGGISFLKLIENNFSDIFLIEVGSLIIFTLFFIVSKNNVEVT